MGDVYLAYGAEATKPSTAIAESGSKSTIASRHESEQAMVVLNLSLALSLTVFLLGFALWPQRGGRVLLDLSRPMLKTKIATAGVMLPVLGVQVVLRWEAGQPATWPFATYVGAMLLYTVYQLLFLGQLQLRERGVKHHGVLVPWRRILSYRWDPDRGEFAVVRVRVKRLIDILPADRWMVPIARKAELEAVLAKQFSEWSTE